MFWLVMTVSRYDMAFFSKSIIITVLRSGIIVRIVRIMLLLVLQKLFSSLHSMDGKKKINMEQTCFLHTCTTISSRS